MSHWRDDYLASLQEAERNNPVNKDLVEACSQLADRVSALEAEKAASWAAGAPASSSPASATLSSFPSSSKPPSAAPASAADPTTPATTTTTTTAATATEGTRSAQLRLDLAEALRGRGLAQARLKTAEAELATLRSKNKADAKRIADITAERGALAARVRDLNEELEQKKKFLKDVQDENLTLNMELNMTTQKVAKVQAENKELVDRWMKRMGREADALNLQNEAPPNKSRR